MPETPTRLVLAYSGKSGLTALVLDALAKASGREDCALCAITYGPLGKRRAWAACERRLGLAVAEVHADRLPPAWGLAPSALPCVLLESGRGRPRVLVARDELVACRGRAAELERRLRAALATPHAAPEGAPA